MFSSRYFKTPVVHSGLNEEMQPSIGLSGRKGHYRPEIDGLRAVAVLAVILFHFGLGLPGGFIGVDIFFVISGFLITGIIRRETESETFSFAQFWERRVRRIFPAIFVVTMATLAAGYWLLLPNELEELGESAIAQTLMLANVYYWRNTGYFDGPAEFKPLLHTWSLAVEEQFYVLLPLLLVFVRRLGRARLFWLLTFCAIISFACSVYGTKFRPTLTFFLLPTRAWELLIGCMLAVLPWNFSLSPYRANSIAMVGLLAIIVPTFCYSSNTPFPGLAAIPAVFGTAAIILATAAPSKSFIKNALSVRPLVFLGLISYSLYLWHWPIVVYTRMFFGEISWLQILLAFIASLVLSVLSWKFVEIPFRRACYLPNRKRLFMVAATLSGVAITVSALLHSWDGCAWRFPAYSPILAEDMVWTGVEYERRIPSTGRISLSDLPTLGEPATEKEKIDFIVLGDSHGLALSGCINSIATDLHLVGLSGLASDRVVLTDACQAHISNLTLELSRKRELLDLIDALRPKNLVLVAFWGNMHNLNLYSTSPTADTSSIIQHGMDEWVKFCSTRDIKLWIVKQVPTTKEPAASSTILRFSVGFSKTLSDNRGTRAEHEKRQARIEEVFQTLSTGGARFVDPAPLLYDSDCRVINYHHGRALYRDNHHLSRWGAEQIRPILEAMFRQMLVEQPPIANSVEGH